MEPEIKKLKTGIETTITTKNGISKVEVTKRKDFNSWVNSFPENDTRKANEIFDEMQTLIRK